MPHGFRPGRCSCASSIPGSAARGAALIAEAAGRLYVGPDNGLFELVLRRAASPRAWEITWRPPVLSASFHGRDLFAPVAARLARGERPSALGQPRRAGAATPSGPTIWPRSSMSTITAMR